MAEPPPLDEPDEEFELLLDPAPDFTLFIPPAFTRFHFARLFWNQILTWASVSLKAWAIWDLSPVTRFKYHVNYALIVHTKYYKTDGIIKQFQMVLY